MSHSLQFNADVRPFTGWDKHVNTRLDMHPKRHAAFLSAARQACLSWEANVDQRMLATLTSCLFRQALPHLTCGLSASGSSEWFPSMAFPHASVTGTSTAGSAANPRRRRAASRHAAVVKIDPRQTASGVNRDDRASYKKVSGGASRWGLQAQQTQSQPNS